MRNLLLFMLAATVAVGCSQESVDELTNSPVLEGRSLVVSLDEEGDETRIQLNEYGKTVWNEGDLVSVFYRSTVNEQWQFQGKTGDRTGNILPVDSSIVPPATGNDIVVVYPYNDGYFYNSDTKNVQASLPTEQTYLKDSYGTNGNIMVSSSEYNQITLKSVCGWLKLQLTGAGEEIESITVRGNSGEQVAGELYINTADATSTLASQLTESDDDSEVSGTLVRPGTILTEVTLNCLDGSSPTEKGVALGAEATSFYIALPPQTFAKGLTVEITAVDGSTMTKSTDKEVIIERNHIKPMAAFKFVNPNTPILPTPANNEIWYTATAKVEPYDKTVFGATYLSNVWDSETGKGVITFEGDVTEIGDYAFQDCGSLTSVTIPDSVTTIGGGAFHSCYSLKEFKGKFAADNGRCLIKDNTIIAYANASGTTYTIPDSVTTIGYLAFISCNSLTSVTIPDSVTTIGEGAFYLCGSLASVTIPDSVTTIGKRAFCYCDRLTSVTIGNSVKTIGERAFDCSSLKEFKGKFAADGGRCLIIDGVLNAFAIGCGVTQYTIPDSVTMIGDYAFFYCTSLTSVTIPDDVTTIGGSAFESCGSLTSVTIPDSVMTIGKYAFSNCTSLTSVTIPDSVTTIGECAFFYCESLKYVYCKPTIPPTGDSSMFYGNASGRKIYVPASADDSIIKAYKEASGWSEYKDYIFEDEPKPANNEIWYTNGSTTEPTVPYVDNIDISSTFGTSIESNTYDATKGCWVMSFYGDLTKIGNNAFKYCDTLTSIILPNSIKTIGDSAFHGCYNIATLNIPEGVTSIGQYAFKSCQSLTSITIPDSVTSIGVSAFESCDYIKEFKGKYATDNGRCLVKDNTIIAYAEASGTTYTIPNGVTTIGDNVFLSCTKLTSVVIPNGVTTIKSGAFYDCRSLISITIPNSVTTIESAAIRFCTSLTSVTIPASVTSVGAWAFSECYSLKEVYCKATIPPTGGRDMFYYNASDRKIYVPSASVSTYKAAKYWSDYASNIFEEE